MSWEMRRIPVLRPAPPACNREEDELFSRPETWRVLGMVLALGLALVWCYWTTLEAMAQRWSTDPQYSHGFLVPIFALAVLWVRRGRFPGAGNPSLPGLWVIISALVLGLVGVRMDIEAIDAASFLVCLTGLVLWVGGWPILAWSWPAIAFLAFMLPLPFRVEETIAHPLRRLATVASTYLLQTLGYPALAEGNVIQIEQLRLGVIEACSGLGMLVTLFALATAMALIVPGPWLDRWVLVLSAIPIAVLANTIRITATGVAFYSLESKALQEFFHDSIGWLMMPLALILLWLELRFLRALLPIVETPERGALPILFIPKDSEAPAWD